MEHVNQSQGDKGITSQVQEAILDIFPKYIFFPFASFTELNSNSDEVSEPAKCLVFEMYNLMNLFFSQGLFFTANRADMENPLH